MMQCNEEATTEVGVLAWHFSSFSFCPNPNKLCTCVFGTTPMVFRFEGMVTMSTKP
jgi:hypothetical protein